MALRSYARLTQLKYGINMAWINSQRGRSILHHVRAWKNSSARAESLSILTGQLRLSNLQPPQTSTRQRDSRRTVVPDKAMSLAQHAGEPSLTYYSQHLHLMLWTEKVDGYVGRETTAIWRQKQPMQMTCSHLPRHTRNYNERRT